MKHNNTKPFYKDVLKREDLYAWDKLAYIIIDQEQPCDIKTLCELINLPIESVKHLVDNLKSKELIVDSKAFKDTYFPAYQLLTQPKQKTRKEQEKTTMTDTDRDLLLLVKKLEEYYKQRGVSYKISKSAKKKIKSTVTFLNSVWKDRFILEETEHFNSKEELYASYIEHTFRNLDDSALNQAKRLVYKANKASWRAALKNEYIKFTPYLLQATEETDKFFSVLKKEIPKNPKAKGHWTTVETFLLSKWETKGYPICKQVLYALERAIVAHLYRKEAADAKELIKIHYKYLSEYKLAEQRNKLDDLVTYIKDSKKNSNVCYGCTKVRNCTTTKTGAIIVRCDSKTTE